MFVAAAITTVVAAVACDDDAAPTPPLADADAALEASLAAVPAALVGNRQVTLAHLREVTQRFRNFEPALKAGFSVRITDCMTDPTQGGMGYHYGMASRIDATPSILEPEVLLYEPQANGRLQLVGVEYVIPFTAWTSSEPPVLWGQEFKQNHTFQVWALHAWIWKANPAGVFADWNPTVSCQYAAARTVHTH
jgi:hypothetical protein